MRNKVTLTLIATVGLIFSACNPYSTWEKSVVNNSSKDIIIYVSDLGGGFQFTDSIIIAPATQEIIYSFGDVVKSEATECDLYISRLTIATDLGFIVTKDIQSADNWAGDTKDADKGFDHSCVYTVTDSDIIED